MTFGPEVPARLAVLGFDERLGARPLKRAIETHVIAPLARLLAARSASPPKLIKVSVDDTGRITIE